MGPNFLKYIIIGVITLIQTTIIMWVLVDILHYSAFWSLLSISSLLFFFKFYSFQKSKMFKQKQEKRNFFHYIWINISVAVGSAGLLSLLVDFMGLSVIMMNPLVVVLGFLVRFFLFY